MLKKILISAVLAGTTAMAAAPAQAHGFLSIDVGIPGVIVAPAPFYAAPAPVYMPAPVPVYAPGPVVVGPAYVGPYGAGYYWRGREWRGHEWREHHWREYGRRW